MITFIVHLRVKPENAAELEALLTSVCDMVREREPGVLYYAFAKSTDDPETYVVVEVYRDAVVHAAHMAATWLQQPMIKAASLTEGRPEIRQYVGSGVT